MTPNEFFGFLGRKNHKIGKYSDKFSLLCVRMRTSNRCKGKEQQKKKQWIVDENDGRTESERVTQEKNTPTQQQQAKGRQLNTFSQSGDLLLSAAATLCRPSVGTSRASKNPTLHHLRFHLIRRPCARTYLSAPDVGTIYILYLGPSPPTRHLGLSPRHAPRHCLAARPLECTHLGASNAGDRVETRECHLVTMYHSLWNRTVE